MSFEVCFSVCGRPKAYLIGTRTTELEDEPFGVQEYTCVFGNAEGWEERVVVDLENDLRDKKHPLVFLRDLLRALPIEEAVAKNGKARAKATVDAAQNAPRKK